MVEVILCDDNEMIIDQLKDIIDSTMKKIEVSYKIICHNDYDDNFMKTISKNIGNKIYFLDIEMPSRSGIDVARLIRKKDRQSCIIFLTSHDELGFSLLKGRINFLTFISKYDDYEGNTKLAILEALKYLKVRRTLDFVDGCTNYSIALDNILYITKDTFKRKTIIVTEHNEYRVAASLTELLKKLDNGIFFRCHRSCIVNTNRTESVNFAKKLVVFDNGQTLDMVSPHYKSF